MRSIIERGIREPSIGTASTYAQRVHRLAWAYIGLFFGSLTGIGLIVWQTQLYVTLSQRRTARLAVTRGNHPRPARELAVAQPP